MAARAQRDRVPHRREVPDPLVRPGVTGPVDGQHDQRTGRAVRLLRGAHLGGPGDRTPQQMVGEHADQIQAEDLLDLRDGHRPAEPGGGLDHPHLPVRAQLDLGVRTAVPQPQRIDGLARQRHDPPLGVVRQRRRGDPGAFGERLHRGHPPAQTDRTEVAVHDDALDTDVVAPALLVEPPGGGARHDLLDEEVGPGVGHMELGVPQLRGFGHHLPGPFPGRRDVIGGTQDPVRGGTRAPGGLQQQGEAECGGRVVQILFRGDRPEPGLGYSPFLPGAPHHPLVAGQRAAVARPGQAQLLAGLRDRDDCVLGEGDDRVRADRLGPGDDQGHQVAPFGLGGDQHRSAQAVSGRGHGGRERAERQQVHCRPCGDP